MKLEQIIQKVWHVKLPKPQLGRTFLRFSEHYESEKFRGKTFSLEEFKEWYTEQRGKFDYYTYWDGFNMPSSVLKPFYAGKFDPLSREEKKLLDACENLEGKFYLIGTDGTQGTLKHEIAHGLYYTRPSYRRDVRAALKNVDVSEVEEFCKRENHHLSVWADETQAYIMANLMLLNKNGVKTEHLKPVAKSLRSIYNRHCEAAKVA